MKTVEATIAKKPESSKAVSRWTLTLTVEGRWGKTTTTTHHFTRASAIARAASAYASHDERVQAAENALYDVRSRVTREYEATLDAATEAE